MMAADRDPERGGFREAVARKGSFVGTMKAVGWSFFGVRKSRDLESDLGQLNPVHIVIAAVLGAALFIGVLVALVHWVVAA